MTEYLDLADYLLIAEDVLGVPAEDLAKSPRIHLADSALHAPGAGFGGLEFYPELTTKAAVLCARLVWNHPLPDGNKRVALLCLREFVERNGYLWRAPERDPDETVEIIEGLASGEVDLDELTRWIGARVRAVGS